MIELLSSGKTDSYKIQTKTISIMVNPHESVKADIVLIDEANTSYKPQADQKFFNGAGEYEVNTTTIEGVQADPRICYRVESQAVSLVHIPEQTAELTDNQIERLSPVDIALIECQETRAEVVSKLAQSLEPRVVVLRGATEELVKAVAADFGVEAEQVTKIKYSAKDLPQDSQKLIVLQ